MKSKQRLYILILLISFFYNFNSCEHKNNISRLSQEVPYDSILSSKLLNSERIKLKYGNYAIKVLNNDSKLRISNLYSSHDDTKTTRTFAIVNYPETIDSTFLKEHKKIIEGGSIGRTFKDYGWEIEKKSIYFGEILPSNDFTNIYKLMGNITPSKLAIHVYEFYIKKNNLEFKYVTIAEIYHPDYLTLNTLKSIHEDANNYLEITPTINQMLEQIPIKMKLI